MIRKLLFIACGAVALNACDKHDPILPGTRTAIFDGASVSVLNRDITDIPQAAVIVDNTNCPYTQDKNNVIWHGTRKIFSGFPTSNTVAGNQSPVCSGGYVYAGLTTGEVVKINPKNRGIVWIADVYRASNLTGGSSMVDIVAPVVPVGRYVYAGGLGDAFCKLDASSGAKKWCADIGVAVPFVMTENYAFVVGVDKKLYAISAKNGDVHWSQNVQRAVAPTYSDGVISVGKEQFSVKNGKKLK